MNNISFFKNKESTTPTSELTFLDYLEKIKKGAWEIDVMQVRQAKTKEKALELKLKAPLVTGSGTFRIRKKDELIKHSGLLVIDIDDKNNEFPDTLIAALRTDKYTYAMHNSIGGKGIVIYVKIKSEKHYESFICLEQYYLSQYKIFIDRSCKDVSRARFVSYDPDTILSADALEWNDFAYFKKKEKREKQISAYKSYVYGNNDIDHIVSQINSRHLDITGDYENWIHIGFSLANEFGQMGRSYFHAISSKGSNYSVKDCDKQYDRCLKSNEHKSGITIATLFYYCRLQDISILTEKTQTIVKAVSSAKKTKSSKETVKEQLVKYHDITIDIDSDEIIDKAWKKTSKQLDDTVNNISEKDKVQIKLDQLEMFLKSNYDFKTNEITGGNEWKRLNETDYKEMTDFDENSIYMRFVKNFGDIERSKFTTLIKSDFSIMYNPLKDYFNSLSTDVKKGELQKLLDCINIKNNRYKGDFKGMSFKDYFITKWLIGCVSSVYDVHSVLLLVFVGEQASGKTKFFRALTPDKLKKYFAENKLTDGKDSDILLTLKWIILDDEFSGKTKMDERRLKEMLSKDFLTLRKPFAKYVSSHKRIANLCATSNTGEIISDITGNRRIVPIEIDSIDMETLETIKIDDVWSEIKEKFINNKQWFLDSEDINWLKNNSFDNVEITHEEEMLFKYFEPCGINDAGNILMTNTEIVNELQSRISGNTKIRPKVLGMILNENKFIRQNKTVNGKGFRYWTVRMTAEMIRRTEGVESWVDTEKVDDEAPF